MGGTGARTTPAHGAPGSLFYYRVANCPVVARLTRYLTMSLRLFKGRTLTTLRAGLALNICSILVKGFIPLRALTAGFWTMITFIRPGTTKRPGPFLPSAFLICVDRESNTDATCLRDSWVSSAMPARISLLDGALAAVAAMEHYSFVNGW